jgi:hypothetical protein
MEFTRSGQIAGFRAALNAPSAGTATVVWYFVPKGAHVAAKRKPVVVASGKTTVKKAGSAGFAVRCHQARLLPRAAPGDQAPLYRRPTSFSRGR